MNWEGFEQLPGSATSNFEMLCRGLIRRHYGRYGDFAALAAQPGVEFHLKLHTACSLGDPGRWYGWQCRWYDLPAGRALGSARKAKIAKAIKTTERELADITDWVLWTRRPLTKGDQAWFRKIKTHMRLHQWTAAEVEEHLSGDAEILRRTYFGELVLSPDTLVQLREIAIAPIRPRWQPAVHQIVDAERSLRRRLAETDSWDGLLRLADQLKLAASSVERDSNDLRLVALFAATAHEIASTARGTAIILASVYAAIANGDLDLVRQQLANRGAPPEAKLAALPRQLRAIRHPAALTTTNALDDLRSAHRLLEQVDESLGARVTAVLADAGCGKTQLVS